MHGKEVMIADREGLPFKEVLGITGAQCRVNLGRVDEDIGLDNLS